MVTKLWACSISGQEVCCPYTSPAIHGRKFSTAFADRYEAIHTNGDSSYMIGVPANTTFAMVWAYTGTGNNCLPASSNGSNTGLNQWFVNASTGAAGTTTLNFKF